jgi:hypothetical protein
MYPPFQAKTLKNGPPRGQWGPPKLVFTPNLIFFFWEKEEEEKNAVNSGHLVP